MPVCRVYFFRHGPASPREAWSGSDDKRPLTDTGRKRTECVADLLSHGDIAVDLVLTSPYTRARETADIVAAALNAPVKSEKLLAPGFSAGALQEILERNSDHTAIVIVGHEPSFSAVISEVIGGGAIVLKKAACARVDLVVPGTAIGELVWLIAPGAVRC